MLDKIATHEEKIKFRGKREIDEQEDFTPDGFTPSPTSTNQPPSQREMSQRNTNATFTKKTNLDDKPNI